MTFWITRPTRYHRVEHVVVILHFSFLFFPRTKQYGDASPECVDLYFAYGKALLENAIAQNSVLGKEESGLVDEEEEENKGTVSLLVAVA